MKKKIVINCLILIMPFWLITQSCTIPSPVELNNLTKLVSTNPYQVNGTWYYPVLNTKGFQQVGIASWYGKEFHGKKTSNREIYNMHAMTAAHKTLPFNSWVRVLNISNGRWVDVRINDRGPFVKNRIIDLSYTASKKIGMIEQGTSQVEITFLGEKKNTKNGTTYVHPEYTGSPLVIQVGAFNDIKYAHNLKDKLYLHSKQAIIVSCQENYSTLYKVLIRGFTTPKSAIEGKIDLENKGFTDTIIMPEHKYTQNCIGYNEGN